MEEEKAATLLSYDFGEDARAGILAFSTTRRSPLALAEDDPRRVGAYAGFNVTDYCGDDPALVERDAQWLASRAGVARERLILPRQTHSARVERVDGALLALDAAARREKLYGVDALVTDCPGVCVGVSTADCVPVLFYDPVRRVAAAAHAGWRGTVSRIVQRTLEKMVGCCGTRPSDVRCVIGPSISAEAFEVGDEVVEAFARAGFDTARLVSERPAMRTDEAGKRKPHIDLWAANAALLEEAGVLLGHIQVAGVCTYTHSDDFFSARRLGIHSGRIYTGIVLRDEKA